MTQNIYQLVQKVGFTTKYREDEEYAYAACMLLALICLENNDICSTFDDISDLKILDLDPFHSYFQDYYIGGFRIRNRRTIPMFSSTFKNVHNLLSNQFDHTEKATVR